MYELAAMNIAISLASINGALMERETANSLLLGRSAFCARGDRICSCYRDKICVCPSVVSNTYFYEGNPPISNNS
jgi:hypothetical protein